MQLLWIDPRALEPDPQGVREDPGDIEGLATTIAEYGLLQPLGVIDLGRGRYRVVYGNRRRLAALKLGLERVPCVLLDPDDPRALLRQLTENLQRRDLNDLEQARAFQKLREQIALDHGISEENALDEATAHMVGLSPRTVRRYLGLLDLPLEIQEYLRKGELNVTQAQHLRRVSNERTRIELARAAVEEGMSAAEISRLASFFAANPNLSLDDALHALQQGIDLTASAPVVSRPSSEGVVLKGAAAGTLPNDEDDADLWDENLSDGDLDTFGIEEETIENQPRNKARVFRIRSLDQMLDETDRLFRAHAEGDLIRWVRKDQDAPMKVGLLLKQLEALSRALREIARQQNWVFADEA